GDVKAVRLMLDHGAEVNAVDPFGRTALMYAAVSDLLPLEEVKLLIERGADVNAVDGHTQSGDAGLTVLEIAKLHGDTPVVDWLVKSAAKGSSRTFPVLRPERGNSVQAAIQRSVPLLQRADATFITKAGCFSCHNNSLEAMAVARVRRSGFGVDESMAAQQG